MKIDSHGRRTRHRIVTVGYTKIELALPPSRAIHIVVHARHTLLAWQLSGRLAGERHVTGPELSNLRTLRAHRLPTLPNPAYACDTLSEERKSLYKFS